MAVKPKSIDDYLAELSADKRAALQKLRQTIKAAAPKAEECISYRLPAFRLNGMLVGFGATTNHCAFYLMSSTTVEAFKKELKNFDTSKGTIRFQFDEPLPATLVRKLVNSRLAENASVREKAGKAAAAPKKRVQVSAASSPQTNPDVIAFISDLDHPLKREIKLVREIILGVSPEIREAIKWNAPSFRTTDFFATFFLRANDQVQLIFGRRVTKATPGRFRTRVITDGVTPSLHVDYKTSRIKQYHQESRALRTETTINDPRVCLPPAAG